jgi:hypothetical protein
MSIAIGLLLMAAPNASAQSAPSGDDAHGPRSKKDAPSTNGPDIWDANHDGIYTPAMSGRVTLIDYLPWPIATATGISIRPNSQ